MRNDGTRFLVLLGVMLTSGVTLACSGGPARPPQEYLVGPLASLPGVALGMTARSLRTVRPGIADAPYTGLSDSVGLYAIFYLVDNMGEDPAPDRAKVREVRAERRFADSLAAKAEEHQLLTAFGSGTLCRTFSENATRREHVVNWDDQEIAVRYRMNVEDEYGRDTTFYVVALHWRSGVKARAGGLGAACSAD